MIVSDIVRSVEGLSEVAKEKMGYDVARRIDLVSRKLETEYKAFQNKKDELIEQFGEEIEGKKSINPQSPKWADFVKELNLILETDIDITVYKVKASLLKDIKVAGSILLNIMPVIEHDTETEEK